MKEWLKTSATVFVTAILSVFSTLWFVSCKQQVITLTEEGAPKHTMMLEKSHFEDLPGWQRDDLNSAFSALVQSCQKLTGHNSTSNFNHQPLMGRYADWQKPCRAVIQFSQTNSHPQTQQIRSLLEKEYQPIAIYDNGAREGLFTGYFEGFIHGSLNKHGKYRIPIYMRPKDLITVNLSQFDKQYKGKSIVGRLKGHHLVPYLKRKQINAGALKNRGLELLWVDNKIDRFFLEIQGSGRVLLDNGKTMHLHYDGQNGARYVAIGRLLVERGILSKDDVSMQKIREYLKTHPRYATKLFNENPSFIFFRLSKHEPIRGSEQVALTARRSLAVDKHFIPLGAPLWLDTKAPNGDNPRHRHLFRRLMVAQDTGGAIKGPVRGDVFYGFGPAALKQAGYMKQPGQYWLLMPKALVKRNFQNQTRIRAT